MLGLPLLFDGLKKIRFFFSCIFVLFCYRVSLRTTNENVGGISILENKAMNDAVSKPTRNGRKSKESLF